ncbi:hypothetical protein DMENIID0001_084980 [Sergentomyia squamirostris]
MTEPVSQTVELAVEDREEQEIRNVQGDGLEGEIMEAPAGGKRKRSTKRKKSPRKPRKSSRSSSRKRSRSRRKMSPAKK